MYTVHITALIIVLLLNLEPPQFMYPPTNHQFDPELVTIGSPDNPTCYICVNCSAIGDPPPVVTWENQYNSMSDFSCIITNQSNASSPYSVQDNGQVSIVLLLTLLLILLQKLCFSDIRKYHSVDDTNYRCTATNVGGSTYGIVNVRVRKSQSSYLSINNIRNLLSHY